VRAACDLVGDVDLAFALLGDLALAQEQARHVAQVVPDLQAGGLQDHAPHA